MHRSMMAALLSRTSSGGVGIQHLLPGALQIDVEGKAKREEAVTVGPIPAEEERAVLDHFFDIDKIARAEDAEVHRRPVAACKRAARSSRCAAEITAPAVGRRATSTSLSRRIAPLAADPWRKAAHTSGSRSNKAITGFNAMDAAAMMSSGTSRK